MKDTCVSYGFRLSCNRQMIQGAENRLARLQNQANMIIEHAIPAVKAGASKLASSLIGRSVTLAARGGLLTPTTDPAPATGAPCSGYRGNRNSPHLRVSSTMGASGTISHVRSASFTLRRSGSSVTTAADPSGSARKIVTPTSVTRHRCDGPSSTLFRGAAPRSGHLTAGPPRTPGPFQGNPGRSPFSRVYAGLRVGRDGARGSPPAPPG